MIPNISDFAQKHFEGREQFLEEIIQLQAKRGINVLQKLTKDHNDINLYSWFSEVRTGIYLDKFCSQLKYEENFDGKTPDWSFVMNNQKVICEVLRLNAPQEETEADIEKAKVIRAFQDANPGVPVMDYGGAKCLSSEYFYGTQSKLEAKVEKYKGLIDAERISFILCIAPSLLTFINEKDAYEFLIGDRKDGFFYSDDKFGKYVSGVLLNTYFGEWYFFNNDRAVFPLTDEIQGRLIGAR